MRVGTLVLILACVFFLYADNDYLLKDYGIKLGVSAANQDFSIRPESNFYYLVKGGNFRYRPGFICGIYAEWFDERYINMVTEINYVQKGTRFNLSGVTDHEYNNRMDYLSIPVYVKLKFPNLNFLPYLMFGFRYDHLIYKRIESDMLLYDKAKAGNAGTSYCAGYEFDAGGMPLSIEYSYHTQYAMLLEEDQYFYTIRNISHSLVLGYRLKGLMKSGDKKQDSKQPITVCSLPKEAAEETGLQDENKPGDQLSEKTGGRKYTRQALVARSLLLPGSAHFSTGRFYSGAAYSLLFAGAVYAYCNRVNHYNREVDEFQKELQKITPSTLLYDAEKIMVEANEMRREIDTDRKVVYLSLAGIAAVYIANTLDAVLLAPENRILFTVDPKISKNKTEVNFSVKIDL